MALAHNPAKPPKPTGPLVKGLPVYTKKQFLQVRPKGSYQGYLNYINRKRGAQPAGTRAAGAAPKVPTYDSLLRGMTTQIETPAQLEARAKRMAEADIASQTQILREDAEAQSKKAHERALALSAAGRAAAGMSAGLFNAVGGEYNAAAGELSRLGQMTGGNAAETAAQMASENARLANVGQAPIEATGLMAGPGQAAVEGYRGGTLAAQNFDTQGQAATFGLAGMVNAANLRATQEANIAYNARESEIQEARTQAVKEIARGRPEAAQKYLLQLQDAQRQQIALAMSLIEARNSRGDQILTNTLAKAGNVREEKKLKLDAAAQKAELKIAEQTARIDLRKIDITRSQALGYVVNALGQEVLDANGQRIPFSTIAEQVLGKKAATMTPGQQEERMKLLRDERDRLRYGTKEIKLGNGQKKVIPASQAPGFNQDDPSTYGKGTNYWTALKRLKSQGAEPGEAERMLQEVYDRGVWNSPIFYGNERPVLRKYYGTGVYENAVKKIRKLQNAGDWKAAKALISRILDGSYKAPSLGVSHR